MVPFISLWEWGREELKDYGDSSQPLKKYLQEKQEKYILGTSLAVQWLWLPASNAGGVASILAEKLRSHVLPGVAKKYI